MDDRVVYSGRSRTIEWAVRSDGKLPALREWNKLQRDQRAKLWAVIKRIGDYPEFPREERFKHERGEIYAIKIWKVRAYCFKAPQNRIVITNIIVKKKDKARPEDLERAERIRAASVNG